MRIGALYNALIAADAREGRPQEIPRPKPVSILEQIGRARSPFDLEVILRDVRLFAPRAYGRHRERWERAAEAKRCEFRGWLYVEGP